MVPPTAASSSARQSAGSAKSSWGKQLAYGGPQGDSTGWEEEDGTQQWQSSGHKTCPTKTQHSPRFTSLPLGRGTEREGTFLFGIFKTKTRRYTSAAFLTFNRRFSPLFVTRCFWFEGLMISLFQLFQTANLPICYFTLLHWSLLKSSFCSSSIPAHPRPRITQLTLTDCLWILTNKSVWVKWHL